MDFQLGEASWQTIRLVPLVISLVSSVIALVNLGLVTSMMDNMRRESVVALARQSRFFAIMIMSAFMASALSTGLIFLYVLIST